MRNNSLVQNVVHQTQTTVISTAAAAAEATTITKTPFFLIVQHESLAHNIILHKQ